MRYPEQTGYFNAKSLDCSCDTPDKQIDTDLSLPPSFIDQKLPTETAALSAPELEKAIEAARRQKLSQTLR